MVIAEKAARDLTAPTRFQSYAEISGKVQLQNADTDTGGQRLGGCHLYSLLEGRSRSNMGPALPSSAFFSPFWFAFGQYPPIPFGNADAEEIALWYVI
jgi:hypothetical protein